MLPEHRHRVRQAVPVAPLEALELEAEHGQGPAHGVQVGADRGAVRLDLGRLVADGPVDRLVAVDPPHGTHVDELELLLGLDDVVRLEVAVHQPPVMQVPQRGQHLDRVRDRVRHRHRTARQPGVLQNLLKGLPAHVLHHDVPGRLPGLPVRVLDEVVDPDDIRVLHLGQELPLGHGRGHRVGVPGVQQALEYHPAVADVAVAGQVDRAEAAVRQAAEHLVLPGDEFARLQLRAEREPGTAVTAEALGHSRAAVPVPADRLVAPAAEPLVLRHPRVGEHRAGRVAGGHRRDLDQAALSRPRADWPVVRRDRDRELWLPENGDEAVPAEPEGADGADGDGGRGQPAGVAVAVLDGPAAARLGTPHLGCTPSTACWYPATAASAAVRSQGAVQSRSRARS